MAKYTPTGAGNLLQTSTALPNRVQIALIAYAATQYSGATGAVATYIRRVAMNPAGEANAVLPLLLATMTVASPGTDSSPNAPTDAELATGIGAIWTFLCGS